MSTVAPTDDQVHFRHNGKFFTEPIQAKTRHNAFVRLVNTMLSQGHIRPHEMGRILDRSFKPVMTTARERDAIVNFMWDRAMAAEENGIKAVFSVFDFGGWRFFGRI